MTTMSGRPFMNTTQFLTRPKAKTEKTWTHLPLTILLIVETLVLVIGAPRPTNASDKKTALEIIQAVSNKTNPETLKQHVTLTLIPPKGTKRTRTFWLQQRQTPEGWQTRIEFLAPQDVVGTTLLILQEKKSQRQYLWLPRLRRTRRVTGKMRSSSFMGSDFTHEDLEIHSFETAHYKRVEDTSVSNHSCYTLEVTPNDFSKSDYGKMVMQIDRELLVPLRVRYFNKNGKETKVLNVSPPSVQSAGKWIIATELTMKNLLTGHSSNLKIDKIDTETNLPNRLFNPGQLGK